MSDNPFHARPAVGPVHLDRLHTSLGPPEADGEKPAGVPPRQWKPRLRCEIFGHAHPMASDWQLIGRERCWHRVVWCPRCGWWRDESVVGPEKAPLAVVSPIR